MKLKKFYILLGRMAEIKMTIQYCNDAASLGSLERIQGLVDRDSLRVHRIIEGIAINWPIENVAFFLFSLIL